MGLAALTSRIKAALPSKSNAEALSASLSTLMADTTRLVELEIALARQELTGLLKRNAMAAGMLVAAALCALMFFIVGQVWLIVVLPHHAVVAGIIAVVWLLLGVSLGLLGKGRLKIEPPKATLDSLKEDLEWVKQQIKRSPS